MTQRRVCDACSIRRIKCDGSEPCAACSKSSLECTRLRTRAKPGPKGVRKRTLDRLTTARQRGSAQLSLHRSHEQQSRSDRQDAERLRPVDHGSERTISPGALPEPPSLDEDNTNFNFDFNAVPPVFQTPRTPAPESWPFSILPALLEPYMDIYHHKLFPVWPIVNRDAIMAKLQFEEPDATVYALAVSVCAATMLQLQLSSSNLEGGGTLHPASMLAEVEDLRRMYDFRENPSLHQLSTSFFMHVAYLHLGRRTTSTLLLREAITLACILNLHKPSHYDELEPEAAQTHLRIYWLLFITERAHATQHDIPCTMVMDQDIPEPIIADQPFTLSAFVMLCRMFRSFYLASSNTSLTPHHLVALNNQLLQMTTSTDYYNELQKADLSVTQQWLRLVFWKTAISKVIMTLNPNDDIRSIFFPIRIAKDLLSNISNFSIDTLEAHGQGMELKLFEVTNSVADMITLNPQQATSALELGPRDFLVRLATIISGFRGGNRTLLPLLQQRLANIGLDASVPRIVDVSYDSPDSRREKSSIETNEAVLDGGLEEERDVFYGPEMAFAADTFSGVSRDRQVSNW